MELLLAFMYQGEVTVASHHIIPLMEAAKLLGVQGLTEPLNSRSPLGLAPQKERYRFLCRTTTGRLSNQITIIFLNVIPTFFLSL